MGMTVFHSMTGSPGEPSKLEQLYSTYIDLMYRIAYRRLGSRQDAEDAVHQAFLSVIPHLSKIGDLHSPKTRSYLVIIVERKSVDILRQRDKHAHVELIEEAAEVEAPPAGDGSLASAIARLPEHQRHVLLLRYDNGFSVREIGKMLGITDSGVRKILNRAKKALEKALAEEGVEL